MYRAVTDGIAVEVDAFYLDHESSPQESYHVWAYTVRITNGTAAPVRLRSRHWIITDGHGRRQDVKGAGVVGEQPLIAPGETFEYSSGTPLSTPSGIMTGSYRMEGAGGEMFDIAIPMFSLDSPAARRVVN
ncbi:MAG: Co2+/Mg2+ efflux protein ApaG [Alphaproteobacteria bacterium]|nr:Co2+/Mg2+ efflux protein ApaG [Alphaproteobacteria bacterium]MDX5369992.1 Co2+/Mg2+ efflux protein ApaG [Alphaproteobacteria bacterium]MDX5464570.1 Co2+/Mg2+ efflux protein ApaG [Alphaproteobacteria bacterium]